MQMHGCNLGDYVVKGGGGYVGSNIHWWGVLCPRVEDKEVMFFLNALLC